MRRLVAYGAARFVEVGPGTVLCGLGKKTAREASFTNIDSPEHLARVKALFTT
jgi:[acyl-carrier-protein] S-malonyltransferase